MAQINALTADVLLKNLQDRCEGLFYMSESEYPLEPIMWEVGPEDTLQPLTIAQLAGQKADAPVEVVDLPYFFRNQTPEVPDADPFIQEMTQRFRDLQAYLLANLTDFKVYRFGRREIQVFGIGKLSLTQWAGFKTLAVET